MEEKKKWKICKISMKCSYRKKLEDFNVGFLMNILMIFLIRNLKLEKKKKKSEIEKYFWNLVKDLSYTIAM